MEFISTLPGSALGILITFFCFYLVYIFLIKPFIPDRSWERNWLSIEDYWKSHPECKTADGTKCFKCGSRNLRQYGYESSSDSRRIHKCNQCNTGLYRSLM